MFTDVRVLAVDTVRVCWRLFPQLLTIYLLGWLASHLALKAAVIVGDFSPWGALAIFSFSFLFTLVAIVLILRTCGRELGIWEMIPPEESVGDQRDSSLTQLLAVTLLPFLGLYAAFGQVDVAAAGLSNEQAFRNSIFFEGSVLRVIRQLGSEHPWRLLMVLAGIYVVRRAFDIAHERTGIRPLGLVVALLESFFILVVIFGGFAVVDRAKNWLGDRAFNSWLDSLTAAFSRVLALVDAQLPERFFAGLRFLTGEIWPVLWPVVSEPIVWLAVAALVFGSQVLSLAELWRKGQPVASRVPGASAFSRRVDKVALRRVGPPPHGVRRVGSEFREAFLGDLDDKYLPTFHSIRLVLRAGVLFLGAYVLLYTAVTVVKNSVSRLFRFVVGGRPVEFWYVSEPFSDLLQNVPWELLRLTLLAVAFRRCLQVFQSRGASVATEFTPEGPTPSGRPEAASEAEPSPVSPVPTEPQTQGVPG